MMCAVCGTPQDLRRAVELAWESGFQFAMNQERVAEAVDDAACATIRVPRLSYEERVAQRIADMERWAIEVRQQIKAEQTGAPQRPWGCS